MKAYPASVLKHGEPILLVARVDDDPLIGDSSQEVVPGDIIFGMTYDEIFDSLKQDGFVSF